VQLKAPCKTTKKINIITTTPNQFQVFLKQRISPPLGYHCTETPLALTSPLLMRSGPIHAARSDYVQKIDVIAPFQHGHDIRPSGGQALLFRAVGNLYGRP
jgi:hypothetical protein